jgi:hypothetical protein
MQMSCSSGDVASISNAITGAQECTDGGVVNEINNQDDVAQDDRAQPNSSSTETQQASDSGSGGGCMDIVKMIVQVAAAVVSVVYPAAAPVAMAIAGAVSKIDSGSEAGGSSGSSAVNMANIERYNDEAEDEVTWGSSYA